MNRKNHEPRRLRVYEQWQGNERFFCWGHCVTGPSWKSGMGSLALLIAPTVIFLVFVVPYMSNNVSPVFWIVSCILPVFCGSTLLMTSCRDPGILPRQEPDEEWLQARKPRTKDVNVNGHRVTVRYNDTCHFYQPPRAHHCSVNDNCIERFDHHCPWVGTTIGKRNYRTFLLFIYGTSVYIAWTFGVSLGSLFVKHSELVAAAAARPVQESEGLSSNLWLQTLSQSGASIALMIFTFIFFWFVCGLSGFHTWLVATNQTTYENFRYNHNQVPNPYDVGLFRNCASVWCVLIPPSRVQFRAFLDEVVREPVELGYGDWGPPAPTPTRGDVQMSPLGGGSGPGPAQTAGEWSGASQVQYGSGELQPQYANTNGNTTQYARAASGTGGATPGAARSAPAAGDQPPPPAAGSHNQSFDSLPDTGELPVSRHPAQSYNSASPPPQGPLYINSSAQGPLAAGLAAVQIPQGDSSAASSPYYTPQQAGQQQAAGPLTVSLQLQQMQAQLQMQQQAPAVQQMQGQGAAQLHVQHQQHKAGSVDASGAMANGHGSWQQQQQQAGLVQQQGLRTANRGPGMLSHVSHQEVRLHIPAAQHLRSS